MKIISNLFLLGCSLLLAFGLSEVVSRYVFPTSPGPSILDMNGNKQKISYVQPGTTFRIITPDFDAKTSITADGYRAPAANGNPDEIFVGDSFTYAQGVEDSEAFAAIYCKAKNLNCANLAVPGSSTLYEIDRLEAFITEKNWRPKKVHFFFFTGNDFGDNIEADTRRSKGERYEPGELNLNPSKEADKGTVETIIDLGLQHSNVLRIAYFHILPLIRNNAEESEQALIKALAITKKEFSRLNALSQKYGFEYQLYSIFTEPEIDKDLYKALGKKLQAQSEKPITMLGDLFKENTSDFYFPTDGHFSVKGNAKLAEFLISQ